MFGKCGSVADAKRVFDSMQRKNRVTWNAMMAAYVQAGENQAALELYEVMSGEQPDMFTFATLLAACSNLRSLEAGRSIHECLAMDGEFVSDLVVQNALLNMYSKCGSLVNVRSVFDGMDKRDLVSWNAVIGAHVYHEKYGDALDLFKKMKLKPDAVTFATALMACANLEALVDGREMHRMIVEAGLESVTLVRNALATMYARCGSLEDAARIFTSTAERDVVSWSALIAAYAQHGQNMEAINLFRKMNLEGVDADEFTYASVLSAITSPNLLSLEGRAIHRQIVSRGLGDDTVVGTALVSMYAKCGDLVTARRYFDRLRTRNVVSWNAMIAGYVQGGLNQEAVALYENMEQEVKPDGSTFASVLAACSSLGNISQARKVHYHVTAYGFDDDLIVLNATVDMYAKCGNLAESRQVFDSMKKKSVVSWTSMITAYARHAQGAATVELVWLMSLEGVDADDVTLTSILQACSHSGLVEDAGSLYGRMIGDHGIESSLEHKVCVVDLLGRAGWLDEAEEFLYSSDPLKAHAASWTSILNACKLHSDHQRGARVAGDFRKFQPRDSAPYVILSNILPHS